MLWYLSAAILQLLPAVFTFSDNWFMYDFLNDIGTLVIVLAAYKSTPIRLWKAKIGSLILLSLVVAVTVHNSFLSLNILPPDNPAIYSLIFISVSALILGRQLLFKWDNLPVDEIKQGEFYEVIGKPKTNLQMLGFLITLGRGGEYSITDGITIRKFSKLSNKLEEIDFDKTFLINKKVIKTSKTIWDHWGKQLGSTWSVFNNCVML